MANNRIFLRCRACGEKLMLGKRFAVGYYWENYGKRNNESGERFKYPGFKPADDRPLEDRLNAFFSDHEFCEGCIKSHPGGVEGWPDHFDIVYEITPSWQISADIALDGAIDP